MKKGREKKKQPVIFLQVLVVLFLFPTHFSNADTTEDTASSTQVTPPSTHRWYFGVGGISDAFLKEVSTSSSGSNTSKLGTVYPDLRVGIRFPFGHWTLFPSLHVTPFSHSAQDAAAEKRLLAVKLDGETHIWAVKDEPGYQGLDIRAGFGVLFTDIQGNGGDVVLNNGNSTSTFFRPAYSSLSRNLFLDLGTGIEFLPGVESSFLLRADLDLWIISLVSSRRELDLVFGVTLGKR